MMNLHIIDAHMKESVTHKHKYIPEHDPVAQKDG